MEQIKWRKIRAGWYVTEVVSEESYIHIKRISDTHPHWGWDIFQSDDPHTYSRQRLIGSCLESLIEAKFSAQDRINKWNATSWV